MRSAFSPPSSILATLALAQISLSLLIGCSSSTSPAGRTLQGSPIPIGNGSAYTWVTEDGSGSLTAVGVTITDVALVSLSKEDTMIELPMPSGYIGVFKGVSLDFATKDAPPYNKPHLDPHFFLIDMNARMAIMDGKDTMGPSNMMMPSGFATDGICEAMMGAHWMDTTAPEHHGQPFKYAFDYGVAKGAITFLEVMCDKTTLDSHNSTTGTIRQPGMMSGMMMSLPSSYHVSWDASAKTTTISLDGF